MRRSRRSRKTQEVEEYRSGCNNTMECSRGRSGAIIQMCYMLAQQENLRVTVIQSAKGAGLVGLSTLAGGLLGGKSGLLVGGALGTLVSYMMTSDFKSVVEVIKNEMTPDQRREFSNHIGKLFEGIQLQDAATGMALLAANSDLKGTVVREMANYFRDQLGLSFI